MRPSAVLLTGLLAIVAACGGQGTATTAPQATAPQATAPQGATPQATTDQGGVPQGTPGSGTVLIHLEVASGALKGTYDVTSTKSDCNWRPDISAATYSDLDKTTGLDGFRFVALLDAANSPTLELVATYAPYSRQAPSLEIDTGSGQGTGTAQLEDKGATIKWTFDGMTVDGIGMKGSIECGPVDRPR